jgi:hypothetical protein
MTGRFFYRHKAKIKNTKKEVYMSTINLIELKEKLLKAKTGLRTKTVQKLLGFDNAQFYKLTSVGIFKLTPSGATVKGLSIKFGQFAEKLEISLTITKPRRRDSHFGKYRSEPHLQITEEFYAIDKEFFYSLAYLYAKHDLSTAHQFAEDFFLKQEESNLEHKASENKMSLDAYKSALSLGKIDWVNGKVYDIRTSSQPVGMNYQWRYNGQDYRIENVSLYWSSQSEIYYKFSRINPSDFSYALEALFKAQGEDTTAVSVSKPSAYETQRRKERDAIDDFYRENKAMNDMYDRAYK